MPSHFVQIDKANIQQFAELYVSVFNAPPWNDGWSVAAVAERFHSFASYPTFYGLGLFVDEAPTGLAFGWSERWVAGWQFHLKEMCIGPNAQRLGFGGKLLTALEQRLAGQGIRHLILQTGESAPARTFYARHGYRSLSLVTMAKATDVTTPGSGQVATDPAAPAD